MRWFNTSPTPVLVAGLVVFIVLLVAVIYTVLVMLTVWAWNTLVHGVFGGPMIEWWHALAMLVLLSIVGACFRSTVTVEGVRR